MKLLFAFAFVAVSACSKPDSCEKVYDKTAVMLDGTRPSEQSIANVKDQVLAACRADIAKHPERQAQLDCILAISDEVTKEKVAECTAKPPAP